MVYSDEQIAFYAKYEKVRAGGKYNMITECDKAMSKAGLTPEQYKFVLQNYASLRDAYNSQLEQNKD